MSGLLLSRSVQIASRVCSCFFSRCPVINVIRFVLGVIFRVVFRIILRVIFRVIFKLVFNLVFKLISRLVSMVILRGFGAFFRSRKIDSRTLADRDPFYRSTHICFPYPRPIRTVVDYTLLVMINGKAYVVYLVGNLPKQSESAEAH